MPVNENGIGHGPQTAKKHETFRKLLDLHAEIYKNIYNLHFRNSSRWRPSPTYHYFDINAGDGDGSPSIAQDILSKKFKSDIDYDCTFYEYNETNAQKLEERFGCDPKCSVKAVSHDELTQLQYPLKGDYGLVYHDPNGVKDSGDNKQLNLELLKRLSGDKRFARVDILIYVSATNWKRWVTYMGTHRNLVDEILGNARKEYGLVHELETAHQWTFLYLTNWDKIRDWQNERFYRLDSSEGRAIIDKMNKTAEQQATDGSQRPFPQWDKGKGEPWKVQ